MTVPVFLRLISCAFVAGLWGVATLIGVYGRVIDGVFLLALAAAFVISEKERARQRRQLRA